VEAFFLPADEGQRLCIRHPPATQGARGALLYIHPFAEEMNKSRRMAALQSRALAAAGYAVLQIDLLGCGDSSGDFGDASWDAWVNDVLHAARWLRERHPGAPLWLWGLRAGALLASQAAAHLQPGDRRLLLWQPMVSGKAALQQFLRLKAAAEMQQQGDGAQALQALRTALAAGQAVQVAGYTVSAALAHGLEQATLGLPADPGEEAAPAQVAWLEVCSRGDAAALLPASAGRADAWRAAGHRVDTRVVAGPAFWQTQEIEDAPALVEATLAVLATAA
jgi:exosortase A-associated hydrolase 2